jgi:hypothetical protein
MFEFKVSAKIKVSDIYWNDDGFFFRRGNEVLHYSHNYGEVVKFSSSPPVILEKVVGKNFFIRNASEIVKISESIVEVVVEDLHFSPKQVKLISEPLALIRICVDEAKDRWSLFAFEFFKGLKWKIDSWGNSILIDNGESILVHWFNEIELSLINKVTGSELWRLDLSGKGLITDSQTGEVHEGKIQFLEVHGDMVVVNMGNGYLAAYRVQDGSLVWERVLEYANPYLKVADGCIYFLYSANFGNRFSVFSLKNGALLYEQPLEDEVIQNESFFTRPSLTKDYFIITGQRRKYIFFFNRQTAALDFKVDLNPYTTAGMGYDNAPQLHGRHLYQLDNEGQLMVFEVE